MISLDTNYLILGLVPGGEEGRRLIRWMQSGEILVTATTCWYEFLCGPVTPAQIETVRACLHQILPFEEAQAVVAARLFNAVGRKRSLRVDCMIAACAVVAGARLATNNSTDFRIFADHKLELV